MYSGSCRSRWRAPRPAAVGLALLAWAAGGQTGRGMSSRGDGELEAVVDERGDLRVPSNYRAAYEFWALGPSLSTRGWDPAKFIMSMRHLVRSPRTTRAAVSSMERC